MRFVAIVLAVLLYQESAACTFSPESLIFNDPIAAMERADAVFSATVSNQVAIDRRAVSRAAIEVHETWKGEAAALRSLDNYLGSTCSRALYDNGRYVFFASRRGKRWRVTGTFVLTSWASDIIEVLRGGET